MKKKCSRDIILHIVVSSIIICLLVTGFLYIDKTYKKQNIQLIKQSVQRTAVECYSVEGMYPPDIAYLEDKYDLKYDHDKYFVFYDTFAENIMPIIEVYEKK